MKEILKLLTDAGADVDTIAAFVQSYVQELGPLSEEDAAAARAAMSAAQRRRVMGLD